MKRNIIKVLGLAMVMVSLCNVAQAQFRQSVYLNGVLPTGTFGKSIADNVTMVPLTYENIGRDASVGFGAGYRVSYRFDVGVGEVAPFASVDVFWNMIGKEWREKYMDAEYSTPTYFNVPLLAGVSYFYDELWNDITPFAELGVGTDLFMITREGLGSKENHGLEYYAYKPNFAMAWMIGAGAWFGRHVSAGLYYYGLGTHPVDYTSRTLDKNGYAAAQVATNEALNNGRQKRTVGELALRIGFHF